jgi:hypothetical protein
MATIEDLNSVIKQSNCRFSFLPKQKEEIVYFLNRQEVPKSLIRVRTISLPEGPKSGNHVFGLVTTQRIIAIAVDTGGVHSKLFFRPINVGDIAVVSEMNGDSFEFELTNKFVCSVQGSKKYIGRLRDALRMALEPDSRDDQTISPY